MGVIRICSKATLFPGNTLKEGFLNIASVCHFSNKHRKLDAEVIKCN